MVRASASQPVDLGSFSLSSHTKKMMLTAPSCLALIGKGIVWRTSRKGCLFGFGQGT